MPKKSNVVIPQDPENLIPVEVIAESIVDMAAAMKRIANSRLSRKALVILVSAHSGIAQYKVTAVLDSLEALERAYLNPRRK